MTNESHTDCYPALKTAISKLEDQKREIERLTRERDVSRAAIEQLHAAVKTAQELAATRLMEIERLRAEVKGLPKARKCMASATSDPPQDCDAPFCGCDPAWSACIEMLQECNLLVSRPAHEPCEQRPADGTRDGDGVWQGGLWHPDPPDPLDEWRLMEFAPKDGTRILALVTEVQFYRDTETPNELIPVVVKWTSEYSGWGMPGHGGLRPTFWLPIKLTNDSQGASRTINSIDDVAAICHSVTGLCCHILGSPGGPCTIGNCAAVRGYLGGPEFAQGASRDASSPCPSVHDHMWRPAQHGEYCIRCNAQRT